MAKKSKAKKTTEDLRIEFANEELADSFSSNLSETFPDVKIVSIVSGVSVKVYAPKPYLQAICDMSGRGYSRRKLIRLTQF